jgi:hypothetical protein
MQANRRDRNLAIVAMLLAVGIGLYAVPAYLDAIGRAAPLPVSSASSTPPAPKYTPQEQLDMIITRSSILKLSDVESRGVEVEMPEELRFLVLPQGTDVRSRIALYAGGFEGLEVTYRVGEGVADAHAQIVQAAVATKHLRFVNTWNDAAGLFETETENYSIQVRETADSAGTAVDAYIVSKN